MLTSPCTRPLIEDAAEGARLKQIENSLRLPRFDGHGLSPNKGLNRDEGAASRGNASAVAPAAEKAEVRSRDGRTIKRTFTALSPEEAKAKEDAAHRMMAQMMKTRGT